MQVVLNNQKSRQPGPRKIGSPNIPPAVQSQGRPAANMAKSIRSKVKKRLRTVKRGVVKAELLNPTSKLGVREVQKGEKMREALSGYIKPGACRTAPPDWPTRPARYSRCPRCSPHASPPRAVKAKRNAFRSDDPEAEIPQHNWQQGPDFRSGRVEDAGYACVGSNRPKVGRFGGDAPSAREVRAEDDDENLREAASFEPVPVKKGQRKKGAASGHETGLGGRPRKLGRQWKKNGGVKQGLGRW